MFTPYFATNQRIRRVVAGPPWAPATRPASWVSARLGRRYCGKTLRRSDTVLSDSNERWRIIAAMPHRGTWLMYQKLPHRGAPIGDNHGFASTSISSMTRTHLIRPTLLAAALAAALPALAQQT